MQSAPITTNVGSSNLWFSPVSSINKTDCYNRTEILLKVVLNTITITPKHSSLNYNCYIDVKGMIFVPIDDLPVPSSHIYSKIIHFFHVFVVRCFPLSYNFKTLAWSYKNKTIKVLLSQLLKLWGSNNI